MFGGVRLFYLLTVLIVLGSLIYLNFKTLNQKIDTAVTLPLKTENILYYGDGCPHCANVEDFLKTKQLPASFKLIKKEVYNNSANAGQLQLVARSCGQTGSVSIPFLYVNDICIIGDADIIKYFEGL